MAAEPDSSNPTAPAAVDDSPPTVDDTAGAENHAKAGDTKTGDLPDAPSTRSGRRGSFVLGVLAIVLGLLCLIAALVLPLGVYPHYAVLPNDPQDKVTSTSRATLLVPDPTSPTRMRELRNAQMTSKTTITAAPDRPAEGDVVWLISTSTTVQGIGPLGPPSVEVVSMNRRTGVATNCCGDRIGTSVKKTESQPLRHQGQFAWPFDVQKRDYAIWDGTLRRAQTVSFLREEKHDGFTTYVYKGDVPRVKMGTVDLPGALFGRPERLVKADSWYATTRTYWIEPATGAPIGTRQKQTQEYTYAGRTVTAFAAETESGKPTGKRLRDVQTGARWLPWVRGRVALVLVPLGVALLIVGAVVLRRRRVRA